MSVMGRLPVGSAWLRGVAGVVMVRVGDGGLSWDARERVGCGERSGCWVVEAFAEPDLVVDGEAAGVADREGSYAGDAVGGRPASVGVCGVGGAAVVRSNYAIGSSPGPAAPSGVSTLRSRVSPMVRSVSIGSVGSHPRALWSIPARRPSGSWVNVQLVVLPSARLVVIVSSRPVGP